MNWLIALLSHHGRFYIALAGGLAVALAAWLLGFQAPLLLGGDTFFLVFLLLCLFLLFETAAQLAKRAGSEDEGVGVVILLTLGAMLFFCVAVFEAVNDAQALSRAPMVLAGVGAVLGWFALHTVMAFHYANLHYFDDPETHADDVRDLDFPGRGRPGPWDFLYFSFVVGMTCQVSDVAVRTTAMRRAVLGHGIVSFFFNTVFIAMGVNAAVALAS